MGVSLSLLSYRKGTVAEWVAVGRAVAARAAAARVVVVRVAVERAAAAAAAAEGLTLLLIATV